MGVAWCFSLSDKVISWYQPSVLLSFHILTLSFILISDEEWFWLLACYSADWGVVPLAPPQPKTPFWIDHLAGFERWLQRKWGRDQIFGNHCNARLCSSGHQLGKHNRDIDIATLPFESVERAVVSVTVQAVALREEPEHQQAVKQASHQAHGGGQRRSGTSFLREWKGSDTTDSEGGNRVVQPGKLQWATSTLVLASD